MLSGSPSDSQRWTHSVCVWDLPRGFTSVSCAPHFLDSYFQKNINWFGEEEEEAGGGDGGAGRFCPFSAEAQTHMNGLPSVFLHLTSHRHSF